MKAALAALALLPMVSAITDEWEEARNVITTVFNITHTDETEFFAHACFKLDGTTLQVTEPTEGFRTTTTDVTSVTANHTCAAGTFAGYTQMRFYNSNNGGGGAWAGYPNGFATRSVEDDDDNTGGDFYSGYTKLELPLGASIEVPVGSSTTTSWAYFMFYDANTAQQFTVEYDIRCSGRPFVDTITEGDGTLDNTCLLSNPPYVYGCAMSSTSAPQYTNHFRNFLFYLRFNIGNTGFKSCMSMSLIADGTVIAFTHEYDAFDAATGTCSRGSRTQTNSFGSDLTYFAIVEQDDSPLVKQALTWIDGNADNVYDQDRSSSALAIGFFFREGNTADGALMYYQTSNTFKTRYESGPSGNKHFYFNPFTNIDMDSTQITALGNSMVCPPNCHDHLTDENLVAYQTMGCCGC